MTTERTLRVRGMDAAVAYLGRIGYKVLATDYVTPHGTIPIVASDDEYLVHVDLHTTLKAKEIKPPSAATFKKRQKQLLHYSVEEDMPLACHQRFDIVTILVIGQDRALLRHHRDVSETSV